MTLILPSPDFSGDWKVWARSLIQSLQNELGEDAGTSSSLGTILGEVRFLAVGTFPLREWLVCDRSLYLYEDYPDLAQALGTVWNLSGDPSGSFRVPDLIDLPIYGGPAASLGYTSAEVLADVVAGVGVSVVARVGRAYLMPVIKT